MTSPKVAELFAKSSARTHSNQSDLRVWFAANHDEFASTLLSMPRGWTALAAEFAKEGFLKPDGNAVDASYARKTWHRVKKSFQRARKPGPIARPVASAPKPAASTPSTGITFATLRNDK